MHITDRVKDAAKVQKVFTEYGCNIKTRVGLHDVAGDVCAPGGVVILELVGPPTITDEVAGRLERHRRRRDAGRSSSPTRTYGLTAIRAPATQGSTRRRCRDRVPATYRTEADLLGEVRSGAALYGVHTARPWRTSASRGGRCTASSSRAFGTVKLAAALANRDLGVWADDPAKADAIERACREVADGLLDDDVVVELLQGGAGTSTNMNVNEVIANRALELLGEPRGAYGRVSPLDDVNLHQSTNDTYPTALRLAAIRLLHELEEQVVALQEAFQAKEKEFAHVVKVGRTQLQDAVLDHPGPRDGRLRRGLQPRPLAHLQMRGAPARRQPRRHRHRHRLRRAAAVHLPRGRRAARAHRHRLRPRREPDRGHAERRRLRRGLAASSRPAPRRCSRSAPTCACCRAAPRPAWARSGCRPRQAGSSIMPGKVNPVIPEAVSQAAMLVMGYDGTIAQAAAAGSLELNPFLPLVAACLLEACCCSQRACRCLRRDCVEGIEADEAAAGATSRPRRPPPPPWCPRSATTPPVPS